MGVLASIGPAAGGMRGRGEVCHRRGGVLRGPLSRVVHVVHVVDARLCLHELLDVDVVKAASAAVALICEVGPLKCF